MTPDPAVSYAKSYFDFVTCININGRWISKENVVFRISIFHREAFLAGEKLKKKILTFLSGADRRYTSSESVRIMGKEDLSNDVVELGIRFIESCLKLKGQ